MEQRGRECVHCHLFQTVLLVELFNDRCDLSRKIPFPVSD